MIAHVDDDSSPIIIVLWDVWYVWGVDWFPGVTVPDVCAPACCQRG
jgi:hypothetical protein